MGEVSVPSFLVSASRPVHDGVWFDSPSSGRRDVYDVVQEFCHPRVASPFRVQVEFLQQRVMIEKWHPHEISHYQHQAEPQFLKAWQSRRRAQNKEINIKLTRVLPTFFYIQHQSPTSFSNLTLT